jgi:hypothetical protein
LQNLHFFIFWNGKFSKKPYFFNFCSYKIRTEGGFETGSRLKKGSGAFLIFSRRVSNAAMALTPRGRSSRRTGVGDDFASLSRPTRSPPVCGLQEM